MAWIRRVRTASGATAVQIAEYSGGRRRIVAHVGSARTGAELGLLVQRARDLLEDDRQGVLELGIEPRAAKVTLVSAAGEPALFAHSSTVSASGSSVGPARVLGTASRVLFDALDAVFTGLGFDGLGDGVFRGLVVARVVEPTSLLDTARVLADLGRRPAAYATMKRTLARCASGNYRDRVAELCFTHALTSGDVSLVLYDVTVRHEALVVRMEVRDRHRGRRRSGGREAGGSLTGESSGRAGAAPTKPCRVSTVGWRGCGERAGEAYARNRRYHLS